MTAQYKNVFLDKAFDSAKGKTLAGAIAGALGGDIAGRRVVIIDHPPTAGLVPMVEELMAVGAEVHLRDHHADADRDGTTVARCRELLGDRAVIVTRAEHPACSTLVGLGEFRDDIVVADADMDGVTAAMKAIGVSYPELDMDAAILDGPAAGKTEGALSSLGFSLVRAWGALPAFGTANRDAVFGEVVAAFAEAAAGEKSGHEALDRLAVEYERKVAGAKALAATAELIVPQVRYLVVPEAAEFDPPTLAGELDRDVSVTVRRLERGPIAGKPGSFGAQISLARTKQGETAGLDLAALVPADWARGPEAGVISNTPFLLHLSPARWEEYRVILTGALAR